MKKTLAVYGALATVLAIMAFAFLLYERRDLAAAHAELDRAAAALAAARQAAAKTAAASSDESIIACAAWLETGWLESESDILLRLGRSSLPSFEKTLAAGRRRAQ